MRRLLLAVCLLGVAAGCHRAARPEVSVPEEAFAGEPVRLTAAGAAAPGAVWFVDGQRIAQGSAVDYAFEVPGVHAVRAEVDGEIVFADQLTVLPRPVLRAVPEDAAQVTWLPRVEGALEPAVDFLERATPSFSKAADEDPFLRYALELSAGPPPPELGLDPEEGLAAFTLPEVQGRVVAIGIRDPAAALRSAARAFEQRGFSRTGSDGVLALEGPEGKLAFAFVEGGYLYLLLTEGDGRGTALQGLRQALRRSSAEGLSTLPMLMRLRDRVGQGQVYVLVRPRVTGPAGSRIQGTLTSLQFAPDALSIDGFVLADGPLWNVKTAPSSSPLEGGAHGPVVAGSLSVAPEELARLLRGVVDEEDGEELEHLARAFAGTLGLTVYLDAKRTLEKMAGAPGAASFSGTVLAHLGVKDRSAAEAWVARALKEQEIAFEKRSAADATAFLFQIEGRRAVIEITADRLFLEAGEPLRDREGGRLLEHLRQRYGSRSFGPGHASLLIDIGQIQRELSGSLLSAFIEQLTAIDTVFVDVLPVEEGARLKGQVILRPR